MKYLRILCLILYTNTISYGQSVFLKGIVKDSIHPLTNVNVIAKPFNKTLNLAFSISDTKGKYDLLLKKGEKYLIELSYLGYDKQQFEWIANENSKKDVC